VTDILTWPHCPHIHTGAAASSPVVHADGPADRRRGGVRRRQQGMGLEHAPGARRTPAQGRLSVMGGECVQCCSCKMMQVEESHDAGLDELIITRAIVL
jgi:hypothetical protein